MTDHVPDTRQSVPATEPLALKSNLVLGPNATEPDLLERLRRRREFFSTDGVRWYASSSQDGDCNAAAVEIVRLGMKVQELERADEGAAEAFGHVVQDKRDLEAECKRLRELLAGTHAQIRSFYLGTPEVRLSAALKQRDELRHDAMRALVAWDGTVLPKSHDGLMQERMECLRAALAGLGA